VFGKKLQIRLHSIDCLYCRYLEESNLEWDHHFIDDDSRTSTLTIFNEPVIVSDVEGRKVKAKAKAKAKEKKASFCSCNQKYCRTNLCSCFKMGVKCTLKCNCYSCSNFLHVPIKKHNQTTIILSHSIHSSHMLSIMKLNFNRFCIHAWANLIKDEFVFCFN
jgi:hypothetical protein